MATVTGVTAARAQEIEDQSVVSGHISGTHLYLTTKGGYETDAGQVVPPPPPQLYVASTIDDMTDGHIVSSTSPMLVAGLEATMTLPVSATCIVTLNAEINAQMGGSTGTTREMFLELLVDGVAQIKQIYEKFIVGWTETAHRSLSWRIPDLAPGPHTFTVRAARSAVTSPDTFVVEIKKAGSQLLVLAHQAAS